MITLTGKHLISGQWRGDIDPGFASQDPARGEANPWTFAQANDDQVRQACDAAQQAFRQYRQTSAEQRADFLDAIAADIEALGEQLVTTAMAETALPQARIEGERGRTCNQLRLFAQTLRAPISPVFIDRANPERAPLPKADSRLGYIPLGPVAVFGASNFPLAFSVAGGDTASALAAGCPVVIKGHPAHPATSELVAYAINNAISRTGMPAGTFSLLQGTAPALSNALVNHPAIKAVGFTGSQKVGTLLNKVAQERPEPIPFYGELGSINPQFILPQLLASQPEQQARQQVQSMMMGHGQFCTSPGLVVLQQGAGVDAYLATLASELSAQAAGTMLTAGIAATYERQVTALKANGKLTHHAEGQPGDGANQTRAQVFTVNAADFAADNSLGDEIFGPCALVVLADDSQQIHQLAANLEGQLTASLHGTDSELADALSLVDTLSQRVGRLIFNQMPTGVEVCHSMNHGGPFPAATDVRTTSVGTQAMHRFQRPICYQNMPASLLPTALQSDASAPQVIV